MSCSENRAREGGCQGARGQGNSPLFETGGAPFFEQFLEALFSFKIRIWDRFWLPKSMQNWSEFLFFLHVFSMSFLKVFGRIFVEFVYLSRSCDDVSFGAAPGVLPLCFDCAVLQESFEKWCG